MDGLPTRQIVVDRLRRHHRRLGMVIVGLLMVHLTLELVPLPDFPGDIMLRHLVDFSRERSMVT